MTLFDILAAIIIGLIVGALAKLIMPGKDPGGCIVTIIIGVAGSFLAAFLGRTVLNLPASTPENPLQPAGFFSSLLGAIIILLLYRLVRGIGRK
jgi:uncharacterized membrane protein YeaQ/YmgE (transglycosylase-associated protein family)